MGNEASILIVDDDAGMCETLSDIMEDWDYRPVIALNGYEAIVKVKEAAFDAILMDIKMPGMNGVETLKEIKRIRPGAVVMMMTAYAVEELIEEALREGAYGVLHKPLDLEKTIGLIESAKERGAILVVDDDPTHCAILKDVLEERGYRVSVALSGEKAIEIARQSRYDMSFIDVKPSGRNGLETYLALKEINPQAATVVMIAYPQEVDDLVRKALEKDAYTCLYKPVDIEEVIRLVEEIWRRKRSVSY